MNAMPLSQITPDQDAIITEIEVAAPPERVFQALTDPAQLIRWWTDKVCQTSGWHMDARLGGKWRFEASDPSGKVVVNGVSNFKAHGEITEFDPPRVLAYTWLGNWHDHPERPSRARWELSETKTGTRVKVIHSGLADQPVARKDYAGGWPGLLALLKKYCE
jgi:uncharacterized protein YndB with AHSA1/START domain